MSEGEGGGGHLERIQRQRRRRRALRTAGLLAVALALAVFLVRRWELLPPLLPGWTGSQGAPETSSSTARSAPDPEPSAPSAEPEPAPPEPAEPPPEPPPQPAGADLPELDESDPWLRERLRELLPGETLREEWLAAEGLVRRGVAAVANVAEGLSPRKHLRFLAPSEPFRVLERDGSTFVDPRSFDRYDPLVRAFLAVPPEAAAGLYDTVAPWVESAWRDLGHPEAPFRDALAAAAREIVTTPRVQGRAELAFHVNRYVYVDPALEDLSPAQKQLLRLGPENLRRVQARVRELASALGIPASSLPATPALRTGPL